MFFFFSSISEYLDGRTETVVYVNVLNLIIFTSVYNSTPFLLAPFSIFTRCSVINSTNEIADVLFDALTVYEHLVFFCRLKGLTQDQTEKHVKDMIDVKCMHFQHH